MEWRAPTLARSPLASKRSGVGGDVAMRKPEPKDPRVLEHQADKDPLDPATDATDVKDATDAAESRWDPWLRALARMEAADEAPRPN